jgi:hypothetical protein
MGMRAAERPPRGPRVFEGPLLLRGTRTNITELIGGVWLVLEIARLLRSRLERPRPVSPSWDLAASPLRDEYPAPHGGN